MMLVSVTYMTRIRNPVQERFLYTTITGKQPMYSLRSERKCPPSR